jgi:hypothetical protein
MPPRRLLRADELAAYACRTAELLRADAAIWLEGGRAALRDNE